MAIYTRILGWTKDQVLEFVEEFRRVIKGRKNYYYHEVRCVYGRKPLEGEVRGEATSKAAGESMQS